MTAARISASNLDQPWDQQRPMLVCRSSLAFETIDGFSYDRASPTFCGGWKFQAGDVYVSITFNSAVTTPLGPHEPHTIPRFVNGHTNWYLFHDSGDNCSYFTGVQNVQDPDAQILFEHPYAGNPYVLFSKARNQGNGAKGIEIIDYVNRWVAVGSCIGGAFQGRNGSILICVFIILLLLLFTGARRKKKRE